MVASLNRATIACVYAFEIGKFINNEVIDLVLSFPTHTRSLNLDFKCLRYAQNNFDMLWLRFPLKFKVVFLGLAKIINKDDIQGSKTLSSKDYLRK